MEQMNKRRIGAIAEQRMRAYLSEKGWRILEMNYRCRQGEIDIVAHTGIYYVFIEVKYRNTLCCGTPEEAVSIRKQRRICNAALYYLYSRRLPDDTPVRFDVAAIYRDCLHYVEDAFLFAGY